MDFHQHNLVGVQAKVALMSGWKSNIIWKRMTFKNVDEIVKEEIFQGKHINSCDMKKLLLDSDNHVYSKNDVVNIQFSGKCDYDAACGVYSINGDMEFEAAADVFVKENAIKQYKCTIVPDKYGTYKKKH